MSRFVTLLSRVAGVSGLIALALAHTGTDLSAQCGGNPIVCENALAGAPASQWDVAGAGDSSIVGFATEISVNKGETVRFKIKTTASLYNINIYRMGYYGGNGARLVASINNLAGTSQPNCLTNATTGLVDCGNWSQSATWTVPAGAVSGIYFAKIARVDNGGASHIVFVVRDDSGQSDLLFQTSDTTWQAYNQYGGNSLYVGSPAGRAYKVSYNRPFTTRGTSPEDWLFNAEYPMVRWLERNGYNVSYFTGVDADRRGAEILEHKVFLSVGHDEYWSGAQRTNVENARNAGVDLAFFSGNEVFWKTRWEPSIDSSATAYRTLVSYKDTHANARIDPTGTWTGTWRDPRFSPPADGGKPENALTGTWFLVNAGTSGIDVPAAEGKARFWRNTSAATLGSNQTLSLPNGTLGYEWDEDVDNGFRPAGMIRLSDTTVSGVQILQDWGSTYGTGTANHALTLYKHSSGALVFGGGTVQWSWGLDNDHDRGSAAPSVTMQQATVNLFADMGVQPGSLQSGLVASPASTDNLAPTSTITSPTSGSALSLGGNVTIQGTATEAGGGIVSAVEVSVDNGATWNAATGRGSWTYNWSPAVAGQVTIRSRAVDDSGNIETPSSGVTVTVGGAGSCPCSFWNNSTVPNGTDADSTAVEVGIKFSADVAGTITAIRFHKATQNTGTHVGHLWTSTGTLLATVTFTGETASGWQQANLSTPVAITASTVYVASYHTTVGRYSVNSSYFVSPFDRTPLHAAGNSTNGVYKYGPAGTFPNLNYQAENYWVDVVFSPNAGPDSTPPTVQSVTPVAGGTGVGVNSSVNATFSEAMNSATINGTTFTLRNSGGTLVPATVTWDASTRTATLQPSAALAFSSTYTATITGGSSGAKDSAGNALASNYTWSFTTGSSASLGCPCSLWNGSFNPGADPEASAMELGVRFKSDVAGYITALRFHKSTFNTGQHTGHLWTNSAALLATVTFTNETASGWQEATLSSPVAITANTYYIASYHAPVGRYSAESGYFNAAYNNPPLRAPATSEVANGIFSYGPSGTFPVQTYQGANYWVDVVFEQTIGPDTKAPTVISVTPTSNAAGVAVTTNVTAFFSEAMNASTVSTSSVELRDASNALIPATVTYDSAARSAVLDPTATLAYQTTYTATVRGGATGSVVKDVAGNALAANYSWSFTTSAPPPPPPEQGPGGPVLVITSATNPFSYYFAEILRAEGLNLFATADVSTVSAATLNGYDTAILAEMALTDPQVSTLTTWVTGGGNLIAMRPDKKLAGLLGLTDAGTTLANAYMLVNTAVAPGKGIVGETMQYHGTADRYSLNGATSVATLYSGASTATTSPAVTLRSVGSNGGQAAAFTYDLARAVVQTRQGNPAWAGQERDGQTPIRSDDLFYGGAQTAWVDPNKIHIPQADEQQRLLANVILHVTADRRPLPRFWYLPKDFKAAVVMTGDDHATGGTSGRFAQYQGASIPGCSVVDWECIRSTSYIYSNTPNSDSTLASYQAMGFEIGLHVSSNCLDWTPASLANFYSTQLAQFAASYPSLQAPVTNRLHCIVWSDYTSQADIERQNGIRFDTNYYYYPQIFVNDRPGFFTGSGWAMRFAKSTGEMIDEYQAATQMTDESSQTYPYTVDTLLDRALGPEGYYGAFVANMHTDYVAHAGSDAIVSSALTRGVPVISSRQMLDWVEGRNASKFQSMVWSGNALVFDIAVGVGANNLRAMLPLSVPAGALSGITRNGSTIAYTTTTIKGVDYAVFAATGGSYRASYGSDSTPPLISAVNAAPTSDWRATITWTTDEASDSRVDYGTSAASLTSFASNSSQVTSHSLTLNGLSPGTTYYYRVKSADALGNLATSPNPPAAPASFVTPPPVLTIADASVTEGNTGTVNANFTVTLAPAATSTVTVNYATANGTATSSSDYAAKSGTLTFAAGITTQSFSVTVNGDTAPEVDETFFVNLSSASGATIGDAQAVGTIVNDEPLPALTINDVTVTEGNTGTVNAVFTVTLSPASSQAVSVNYSTSAGTGTAGSDYTTTSGTLNFAVGITSQTITVPVVGDVLDEADEAYAVNLATPTNATISDAQGAGTITDDDPSPSINIADAALTEGNTGSTNMQFTVTLSAASGRTVTVGYATADGTAAAGSDYTAGSGTVTFAAGVTSQTVTVAITGDTRNESAETLNVNLSSPTNATIADGQGVGTINNDDPVPSLAISDVSVTEGNTGTVNAVFTVTLSAASGFTVTVGYATADNTATTAGNDYAAGSGVLTFTPGLTSQTVTVAATGDTAIESNESFFVNLSTPTNATIADAQGVGTIVNDDGNTGLIAAFGFEEGTGTSTADKSGSGNAGAISGATWTTTGHAGKALSFDGVNDWVTVADSAALDVTRITMMAWVRPTTVSDWQTVLLKERSGGLAYSLYANETTPRPGAYVNTGSGDRDAVGTTGIAANTWTHLAATYDGTTLRVYVNGTQVGTRAVTGNIMATTGALRIGGNSVWGEDFAGLIDDVRIYNRALTAAEIVTDMNTAVAP